MRAAACETRWILSIPGSSRPTRIGMWIERASAVWQVLAVLAGTGAIALSSWIAIPMTPVPVTMQTCAVLLIGAVFGARLAFATVLAFLAEAAIGLPVLAGGASGAKALMGPTAGYLAAFLLAAPVAGYASRRAWFRSSIAQGLVMLGAHALILAIGASWLSRFVGAEKALSAGVTPFLVGAVIKSAIVVAILWVLPKAAVAEQKLA